VAGGELGGEFAHVVDNTPVSVLQTTLFSATTTTTLSENHVIFGKLRHIEKVGISIVLELR
jgi:hypothetical protein